jgi:WD40 repeat protein
VSETLAAPAQPKAQPRRSPFQGLDPYSVEDAAYFFGRKAEQEILAANLMSARFTVLYGPSGVGKSSLLRAGLQSDLLARARVARERGRGLAIGVFTGPWRDQPLAALDECIRRAVEAALGAQPREPDAPLVPLAERLRAWTEIVEGDLLLVLDQFEEYFLYHPNDQGPGSLDFELPQAVTRPEIDVSFLLSIRDDALAGLDRFKGRIPSLFENYIRLNHLTRAKAEGAIEEAVKLYNAQYRAGLAPVTVDPKLTRTVLEQVTAGRVVIGQTGRGARDDGEAPSEPRVETSHLQLVLERVWEEEMRTGSDRLRVETLDRLGGSEEIVRAHVRKVMAELAQHEQDVLASIFDRLVTPSGTKIAHAVDDLAKWAGRRPSELAVTLTRLSDARILRAVPPPPGARGGMRYEIFHDVLAKAILDWRDRMEHERATKELAARAEREAAAARAAQEQAAHEHERARRDRRRAILSYVLAALAVLALVIALGFAAYARQQRNEADSQSLAVQAAAALAVDPQKSLQLALDALDSKKTTAGEEALREAFTEARLRAVLPGRSDWVTSAAFSPNGKYVATGSPNGNVGIWDWRAREEVAALDAEGWVNTVAFSRDGSRILTADDKAARLWDFDACRRDRDCGSSPPLKADTAILSASLSRDGRFVATTAGSLAEVWPLEECLKASCSPTATLRHPERWFVNQAIFSGDGEALITGTSNGQVRFWDWRKERLTGPRVFASGSSVDVLTLAPGGRSLAAAGETGVRLWDVSECRKGARKCRLAKEVPHPDFVNSVEFSPRADLLLTASEDGRARIWDIAAGETLIELRGHRDSVFDASFSRGGSYVVTGSADRSALVWDVSQGRTFRGHRGWVVSAEFSRDSEQIVTASTDETARVHDATGALRAVLPIGERLSRATFNPSGERVVTVTEGGATQIWNLSHCLEPGVAAVARAARVGRTGPGRRARRRVDELRAPTRRGCARPRDLARSDYWVNGVDFSPRGRLVITADNNGVARVIDVRSGDVRARLAHGGQVLYAAFSPTGDLVVTTGADRLASIWDIRKCLGSEACRPVRRLLHPGVVYGAAFAADGRHIVTGSGDRAVRIWDWRAAPDEEPLVLSGHTSNVRAVAFSRDGKRVASVGADKTTRVWDARTGELLAVLRIHVARVQSVEFSRDGSRILTASDDGTAKLYPCPACLPLDELRERAEARRDAIRARPTLLPSGRPNA